MGWSGRWWRGSFVVLTLSWYNAVVFVFSTFLSCISSYLCMYAGYSGEGWDFDKMVENIDQVERDCDDGDGQMGDIDRWNNREFNYLSIGEGGLLCRWVVSSVSTVEWRGSGGGFW